ncbi:MAG: outer membrane beta-barrel protein [Gammaproteobacteria bacterium]|nr:outer membrane beta-barrel protein [Gammaproteobacteria bacterium]
MKKTIYLLSSILLIASINTYAMERESGPYLGGQIGWGRIDEGNGYRNYIESKPSHDVELGTFTAWRAYGGYHFAPFFSIESGYSYYPDNTYTSSEGSINAKSYTIDLVGKIILPLEKLGKPFASLSIYGKGGAAYINTKIDNTIDNVKNNSETIMPTYGAGIIYNFTDNIAVDASWTGVMGRNYINSTNDVATKNPVPNCNLFTLGLSYKITGIF